MRRISLSLLLLVAFASVARPQEAAPTPEAKKANLRPAEIVSPNAEPFDKADVKTMASKCVKLETEVGEIEIELYPEFAPESVRNFLNLVSIGAFDTTTFHRVVPGFVVQGGSVWTRSSPMTQALALRAVRKLADEPNNILHERGVVSMAKTDQPNSASTSFFIVVGRAEHLDGKFSAFGRVTTGMEVADAINKASVKDEKPDKPVRLRKATVISCVVAN